GDCEYIAGVTGQSVQQRAALGVPNLDGRCLSAGGQETAVVAERDAIAVAVHTHIQLELGSLFCTETAGIPGPYTDRSVVARGCQAQSVRAESHTPYLSQVPPDHAQNFPGDGVVDLHGVLRSFAHEVASGRIEGDEERHASLFADLVED